MSEHSTEATVAGEAAAAAVDEIQTREALTDTVAATASVAMEAEERAGEAQADAQIAAEVAIQASTEVSSAHETAARAEETAVVAASVAGEAVAQNAETEQKVATVEDKLDMILAHLTRETQQETAPEVTEVEVHDNAPQTSNESGEESGSVQSGPARRRAGRFNRRDARRGNGE